MPPQLAGGIAMAGSDRRPGFWRSALVGTTPQVVAIVAALLFIRMLSSTIERVFHAANNHELGG
jgi:hypothetical protein